MSLPEPPDEALERLSVSEFRNLLDERSRAMDEDPAGNLDAHAAIATLRAKYE
ncbi:MAG: hypothetical protein LBO75_02990 [Bifidobacteriaceae bacterium]|nr:hypothetical protein [Bifidobacteriaceae bacterium]